MAKLNFSASESPKEKEKKGFWSQSFPLCRYLLCFLHSSTVRMGAPFTPRQQQGAKLMCHHLHQHRLQEPIPPLQASSVDHHNHGAFVFKSNCFFFFFLKGKKNVWGIQWLNILSWSSTSFRISLDWKRVPEKLFHMRTWALLSLF